MKANEIRIGNLVKRDSQPEGFYIDSSSFRTIELHPDWYEPIPLTEEWYLRLGFKKINHIHGYSFWSLIRKRNSKLPAVSIYENHTQVNDSIVSHLKFVHQIQNLIFALTGEELTIT